MLTMMSQTINPDSVHPIQSNIVVVNAQRHAKAPVNQTRAQELMCPNHREKTIQSNDAEMKKNQENLWHL